MITEQVLRSQLYEGQVTVSFTKKSDGATRVMRCTTNRDLIPKEHWPKSPVHEAVGTDSMEVLEQELIITDPLLYKVYDLDAQGWRSFRYESIIQIHTKEG